MKQTQKTQKTTLKFSFLNQIAIQILAAQFNQRAILDQLKIMITKAAHLKRPGYEAAARKLFKFFSLDLKEISIKELPQQIFKAENAKLNFLNWSTLPGVNCPGAGSCFKWIKKMLGTFAGWCYSFRGWRNPYAFTRQLLNTVLERGPVYRVLIVSELKRQLARPKFKNQKTVDFRLYVDGDFPNLEILRFWMDTLKKFPQIRAYGYSKSLHLFQELDRTGYQWPANYALNLSAGGIYENSAIANYIKKMNIYRGEFVPVKVTKNTLDNWNAQTLTRENRQEIRANFPDEKVFICPKICGTCTAKTHACGDRSRFKNIKIVLPVH